MYLATIALALLEGPGSGALAGFVGGMAQDFLLNHPKGITALTLTLLGYAVGQLRAYVSSPSPWLPVVVVGAGTFAGVVFHGVISFLLNQLPVDWLTCSGWRSCRPPTTPSSRRSCSRCSGASRRSRRATRCSGREHAQAPEGRPSVTEGKTRNRLRVLAGLSCSSSPP